MEQLDLFAVRATPKPKPKPKPAPPPRRTGPWPTDQSDRCATIGCESVAGYRSQLCFVCDREPHVRDMVARGVRPGRFLYNGEYVILETKGRL